jgi:hypothetical protein
VLWARRGSADPRASGGKDVDAGRPARVEEVGRTGFFLLFKLFRSRDK